MHSPLWFGACLGLMLHTAASGLADSAPFFDNPFAPAAEGGSPGIAVGGPFIAAADGTPPPLSIRDLSGQIAVSWPASAAEWGLDYSARWPSGSWFRVSPLLYETNGDQRLVSISALGEARFFRLHKMAPVPGQTGLWSMDEGTGTLAGEANGVAKALTLLNVAWAPGRIGAGSLRFQGGTADAGSRAWVSNANYTVLPDVGHPFSVSFWFSPDPDTLVSTWRGLAGNAVDSGAGWYVAVRSLGPGTNELVFAGQGASDPLRVMGQTLLLPGQWHQLAVSYDGVRGSLYLDATLLGESAGALPTHGGPIYFGGGIAGFESFVGRLDEIRARTNQLTLEDVSLRGYWRFDEPNGASLADSGIEGHDAVLAMLAEATASARVNGRDGGGIDLRQGRFEIPNTDFAMLPESGGAFSVSCWLRPGQLPAGRSILMRHGVGTSTGWELAIENEASTGSWLHWDARSTGGTLDARAPVLLAEGVWSKLDLTYNGGVAAFYLNGRKVHEQNGAIEASRGSLVVGTWPDGPGLPGFNGVIDDLKIYSRERQPSEIGPVARVMWETVHRAGATNLSLQGFGPVGRSLSYAIVPVLTPTNGVVTQAAPGSPEITFQAGTRRGPDAFTYTVSDGEFTTEPTTVVLSVVEPHWLSPGGSGTQDGRSAGGAWAAGSADALDAIWRTNNYYDCFYYAPGVYETRGWRYGQRSTASPGCKHVGAGSEGPVTSTLRLVDIWEPFIEEMIFAPAYLPSLVNNFEVHHLVLDCNATNLPKFNPGPPEWIRIPLRNSGRVEAVTFRWSGEFVIPGLRAGQAAEFTLTGRRSGMDVFTTNYVSAHADGEPDTVQVGVEADELFLQLTRRSPRMDVYGIREIEVAGAEVSLPQATKPGGTPSQLNTTYAMAGALDGDPSTAWASGPEEQVRIELPLAPGTALTQVNVRWNCRTLLSLERLGPAVSYEIQARDEITGLFQTVPALRHGRAASGWETNTFGMAGSTNAIVTDRLALVLNARELGVNYYSIRELTFQNGAAPVALRIPTALSSMNLGGSFPPLKAFDQDTNSWWASKSQGAASAINVAGNNLKLTHLKVIGFGTRAGRECFPIFLTYPGQGGSPNYLGNVLVEDCVISDPAPGNTDGLSAIDMAPAPPDRLTNAVVRRCTVRGVKRDFTYSNGIAASVVEQCVIEDCKVGVYFEPEVANLDDVGPILIRSNQFLNVTHGVYLLYHARSYFDSLAVFHNEIVLDDLGGYGLAACDTCAVGPSGTITNLTCLDNIIRYQDWTAASWRSGGGLVYSDMQHAVLGNNLIVMDPAHALRVRQCPSGLIPSEIPPEDCDHPNTTPPDPPTYPPCVDALRPGYRRAWFNNRDLSGQLLPIRFANSGVDGLASQQQWKE